MDAKRKVQALADAAAYAAKPIEKEKGHIKVVSHYDADGICAAAIMYKTLNYLNKDFEISFVKQLGKEEIRELARENNSMLIFTDIGSGQLDLIGLYLDGITVVVLDHHPPMGAGGNKLYHLNPHLVGIDGANEISGAGVSYVLARRLSIQSKKLSYLAIVGAAGDMQYHDGKFSGINGLLLEDAEYCGTIKSEKGLKLFGRYTRPIHKAIEYSTDPFIMNVSGNESGAVQFLSELGIPVVDKKGKWRRLCDLTREEEKKLATVLVLENMAGGGSAEDLIGTIYKLRNNYDVKEFSSVLNACGRLEKPIEGLKICLGSGEDIDRILYEYRKKIANAVNWAKKNRKEFIVTDKATYVIASDHIDENIIGTVISIILKNKIKTNIIFGFGGAIDAVKVSARAQKKSDSDLGDVIRKIVENIGGEAEGGGHANAAGAKIPRGSERKFIELAEEIL
ncbi:MAG: DHH family phosphoesterase [archaeon]